MHAPPEYQEVIYLTTSLSQTNTAKMPKIKYESSIPLHCNLCSKKPTFSDVSHLLTHISSKSHLSDKFKLQIRANTDPSAKELLDDYEQWYSDNNLDALLADRMSIKDGKKSVKPKAKRSTVCHMRSIPETFADING